MVPAGPLHPPLGLLYTIGPAGSSKREVTVSGHTYGVNEIVGTSEESITDAIRSGVARASQTVRNLDWFEVTAVRGYINQGAVNHFQVQMKVGFRIESAD